MIKKIKIKSKISKVKIKPKLKKVNLSKTKKFKKKKLAEEHMDKMRVSVVGSHGYYGTFVEEKIERNFNYSDLQDKKIIKSNNDDKTGHSLVLTLDSGEKLICYYWNLVDKDGRKIEKPKENWKWKKAN